ncbi:hypothetical protein [Mycolicibacterium fortuitum]|uniref:hypothetical protein n=1 Tax=Mycolicibacterium TaxID=1866885 RepID=UPI003AADE7E6
MTKEQGTTVGGDDDLPGEQGAEVPHNDAEVAESKADRDTASFEGDSSVESSSDRSGGARRISLSLRSVAVTGLCVLLVAATAVMAWLYLGERNKVQSQQQQAANYQHAEQVALDYAVNAAVMDFQDLNKWKSQLVKGTTPALAEKLGKAATQMEQLLVPLQWNSTAQPLAAKVRSDTGGVYVVDTFVTVLTKTTQAPDNLQSTATYSITIDSNEDWQISDVGGIGAVLGPK